MRQIFIVIFLCFAGTVCKAQIDILSLNLTDSSLNIFYIGVDNYIQLTTNEPVSGYKMTVEGSESRIMNVRPGVYMVKVYTSDSCKLTVQNNNGKVVLVRKYKVDTIKQPLAVLSGEYKASMTKGKVLANPFLFVITPGCYYKLQIQITSFNATFIHATDSITIGTNGYRFSEEQIRMIKTLEAGDEIYFNSIRAVGADSRTTTLNPIWIRII